MSPDSDDMRVVEYLNDEKISGGSAYLCGFRCRGGFRTAAEFPAVCRGDSGRLGLLGSYAQAF